jgi:Tol biopolymer transport system component
MQARLPVAALGAIALISAGALAGSTGSAASPRVNGVLLADGGAFKGTGLLVSANPSGGGHRRVRFPAGFIAASPDGRRLAVSTKDGLFVYDVNGRHRRRISRMHIDQAKQLGSVGFSPGGARLVFEGAVESPRKGAPLYTIRTDGRGLRRLSARYGYMPRWSPDGRTIAFIRASAGVVNEWGDLYAVPAGGGKPRLVYRAPFKDGVVASYNWSPDGRRLVLDVEFNGTGSEGCGECPGPPSSELGMTVIDRRGHEISHLGAGSYPVWSPDGSRIAYIGSDGVSTPVLTVSASGGKAHRVMNFPSGPVLSLAWLPKP